MRPARSATSTASHLTPHASVDISALGADVFACSPYKFCGPHLGVLAAAPELLDSVHPDKLAPSANTVPERFEFGTLPYELLAGTTAAVDFLAGLVPTAGSRRASLEQSMAAVEKQESELLSELETGLRGIDGVDIRSRAPRRTPTVLFTVADLPSAAVSRALADVGVNAPAGSFYAPDCARLLGLADVGAVRAGSASTPTRRTYGGSLRRSRRWSASQLRHVPLGCATHGGTVTSPLCLRPLPISKYTVLAAAGATVVGETGDGFRSTPTEPIAVSVILRLHRANPRVGGLLLSPDGTRLITSVATLDRRRPATSTRSGRSTPRASARRGD